MTGIFMEAQIRRKGDNSTVSLSLPSMAVLSEATAEVGMAMNGRCTAVLSTTWDVGQRLLEDPTLFIQGNYLEVRFGYANPSLRTPWFSGLLKPPGVSFDGDGISITLEADGGAAVAYATTGIGVLSGNPLQVLNGICDLLGLNLEIDNPDPLVNGDNVVIEQANQTIWMVLRNFAWRYGYEFFVVPSRAGVSTLRMRYRASWMATPSSRTYVFRKPYSFQDGIYPVISFSVTPRGEFITPGTGALQTRFVNESGKIQTATATTQSSAVPVQGQATVAGDGSQNQTNGISQPANQIEDPESGWCVDIQSVDPEQRQRVLQLLLDDRSSRSGVVATVTTLGDPLLLAGEIVKVDGVTSLYNGVYSVTKVTHRVGSSGYETEWTGFKNAWPAGFAEVNADTRLQVNR